MEEGGSGLRRAPFLRAGRRLEGPARVVEFAPVPGIFSEDPASGSGYVQEMTMIERRSEEERTGRRPRMARALASVVALLAALPVAGCFTYAPAEPPGPVLGQQVRVELTGTGRDRLLETTGLDDDKVQGELLAMADTSLTVAVVLDADRLGFGREDYVDTMQIARRDVREVGVKAFSPTRSALMAAAFVAAGAAAWAGFSATHSGSPPPDGGNTFLQLPVHRVLQLLESLGGG